MLPYLAIAAFEKDFEIPTFAEGFQEIKIFIGSSKETLGQRDGVACVQLDGELLSI